MTQDIAAIMAEPPGGANHGRIATIDPEDEGRWIDASPEAEWMRDDQGFGIVETSRGSDGRGTTYGAHDAGMTTHRGVLHPDEYVDSSTLRLMIEKRLGFTYEEITSVYRQGPLAPESRQLRDKIDARMLALSRAGANMTVLADGLGIPVRTIENAVRRARES